MTTPITPRSTIVNWKQKDAFWLVIEVINKNNKAMVEDMDQAMDHMNITHMEIEEKWMTIHGHIFKECFEYLKEKDQKIH